MAAATRRSTKPDEEEQVRIGPSGQEVVEVPIGAEAPDDAGRKMVVQVGPEGEAAGPDMVTADEDIVQEFVYPGTNRPAARLLLAKGQSLPRAELDRLMEQSATPSGRGGSTGKGGDDK